VLDFKDDATVVMIGAMGLLIIERAKRVRIKYEIGFAQYAAALSISILKPRHRKTTHFQQTAEHVACAVLRGCNHTEQSIRRCSHSHVTEEMLRYPNREAAAENLESMNSILGYCELHSGELLVLEMFSWNFFESNYVFDGVSRRKQSLFEIFGDRECLIEEYEQQVKTWKRESEVQA
jgi:hypothetical protein